MPLNKFLFQIKYPIMPIHRNESRSIMKVNDDIQYLPRGFDIINFAPLLTTSDKVLFAAMGGK